MNRITTFTIMFLNILAAGTLAPLPISADTLESQSKPIFGGMMPSGSPDAHHAEYAQYQALADNKKNVPSDKSGLDSPAPAVPYTWLYQQNYNVSPVLTLSETTSTLHLDNISLAQSGYYTLRSMASGYILVYDPVQVLVLNAPIITQQPIETHLVAGETLSLSVAASGGTPPLFYQWYKDDGSGFRQIAIGDTLQIQNTDAGDQGAYKCIVVDSALPTALTRDSTAVDVSVLEIVDSPPSEIIITSGQNYTMTHVLNGGDVPTPGDVSGYAHLWEYLPLSGGSFTPLPAGIDNTFTISNASDTTPIPDGHQGFYRYTVSDNTRSISKTLKVFVNANPILISAQPQSAGAYQGSNHTLSVDAVRQFTPLETLQFSWQYQTTLTDSPTPLASGGNLAIVSTATHSELTLSNLSIANSGYYTCLVSTLGANPITVATFPVRLNVGQPLSINLHPIGGVFHAGDLHSHLAVQSSGGIGNVTYQWWHQSGAGTVAVGGDTPTLDLSPLAVENTGHWYCVVQDEGMGEAPTINPTVLTSDTAELTVAPPVTLNASVTPALTTLSNGASVTLALDTTNLGGEPPYTFQWYRTTGNTPIVGAENDTLQLSLLTQSDTDLYYCRIVDSIGGANGTTNSALAQLRVAPPLQIIDQPSQVEIAPGGYAMLEIVVDGGIYTLKPDMPYTYTWEKIGGQNKGLLLEERSYLELSPANLSDAGQYRCTVTNGSESVQSGIIEVLTPQNGLSMGTPYGEAMLCAILLLTGILLLHRRQQV